MAGGRVERPCPGLPGPRHRRVGAGGRQRPSERRTNAATVRYPLRRVESWFSSSNQGKEGMFGTVRNGGTGHPAGAEYHQGDFGYWQN